MSLGPLHWQTRLDGIGVISVSYLQRHPYKLATTTTQKDRELSPHLPFAYVRDRVPVFLGLCESAVQSIYSRDWGNGENLLTTLSATVMLSALSITRTRLNKTIW